MTRYINIDGFAGTGGASLAMEDAGIAPDVALNHNAEAIAIHAANHPNIVGVAMHAGGIESVRSNNGRVFTREQILTRNIRPLQAKDKTI